MAWKLDEIMVYVASKTIKDHDVVLVGTGLPLVTSYYAQRTHAPNLTMVFESGAVSPVPKDLAVGPGDFPLQKTAIMQSSLFDALSYAQRGIIDVGFLGGAEIDEYGNINTTVIGSYNKPDVRLPGSGGANDIASCAKKTIIIAKHKLRTFPKKLCYITTPGYLSGVKDRKDHGLRGEGPACLVTDFGLFVYDEKTRRTRIKSIHPGVTKQQIIENTGFEILGIEEDVPETQIGGQKELDIIRSIDPTNMYLGK